jgi:hypothetical protein
MSTPVVAVTAEHSLTAAWESLVVVAPANSCKHDDRG